MHNNVHFAVAVLCRVNARMYPMIMKLILLAQQQMYWNDRWFLIPNELNSSRAKRFGRLLTKECREILAEKLEEELSETETRARPNPKQQKALHDQIRYRIGRLLNLKASDNNMAPVFGSNDHVRGGKRVRGSKEKTDSVGKEVEVKVEEEVLEPYAEFVKNEYRKLMDANLLKAFKPASIEATTVLKNTLKFHYKRFVPDKVTIHPSTVLSHQKSSTIHNNISLFLYCR